MNSARYYHKWIYVFMSSIRYSCQILMKLELTFPDIFFEKYSNIKFHDNLATGSWVVPCGRAGQRTDRYDEANSRFSQFWESTWKLIIKKQREIIIIPSYSKLLNRVIIISNCDPLRLNHASHPSCIIHSSIIYHSSNDRIHQAIIIPLSSLFVYYPQLIVNNVWLINHWAIRKKIHQS